MDEHDDYRRIAFERGDLIRSLRDQGAVDLDVVRGAGFASKPKVVRKAHTGAGSGTYIGTAWEPDDYAKARKRRH